MMKTKIFFIFAVAWFLGGNSISAWSAGSTPPQQKESAKKSKVIIPKHIKAKLQKALKKKEGHPRYGLINLEGAHRYVVKIIDLEKADEKETDNAFLRLLQEIDGCITQQCSRWDSEAAVCVEDTNLTFSSGACVCDAGNHWQQARREPTADEYERPRCVRPISNVRLKIQTADFRNAGFRSADDRDHVVKNWIQFDLCSSHEVNDEDCLRCKFNDDGPLTLNRGDYETVDLGAWDPQGLRCDSGARSISDLVYPDDVQFFRFYPEDNGATSSGGWLPGRNFDAWLLAGVELEVCLEGDSDCQTVYRNPCVNRWIEAEWDRNREVPGDIYYSPHSLLADEAYCFYLETPTEPDASTDSTVNIYVPIRPGYSLVSRDRYFPPASGSAPDVAFLPETNQIRIHLNWDSGDDAYNDFTNGYETSYGGTIYNGGYTPDDRFRIQIEGGDAWKLARVRAYRIQPWSPHFINDQVCMYHESYPNAWLSTDASDGYGTASQRWPSSGWQDLDLTTCPSFDTIQWGDGSSGAYGFGRR